MADGFEPYHVPQQSRRDKLRVTQDQNNHHLHSCNTNTPLFPTLYDPSLLSSDLINLHRQSFNLGVKEEGLMMNFMGNNFMGGVNNMINTSGPLSSSLPTNQNHHMYADPQLQVNPSSIHHQQNQNNFNTHPYYRAVLLDQNPTNQSLSLELNLQRHDDSSSVYNNRVSGLGGLSTAGYVVGNQYGSNNNNGSVEISRSSVPLGPFTGYASVLNGSRFLKPAQLLLDELCDAGRGVYVERNGPDPCLMDLPPFEGHHGVDESVSCSVDMSEQSRKKSGLLSMLDEVYKRYKMYYQQIQAVIASFESVAGLSNAAPFANLALKALTKHFRSLKNTITDQLQFASKSHGNIMNYNNDRDENQILDNSPSGKGPYGQRSFQHASFVEQPVWRPQRGLPERAVTVLRAWLFEHFLHPYPTDNDKLMLAKQTGLSRNQVSNWFINARVRLWKPMVEEIHTLETRQTQKHSQREEPPEPSRLNDHLPINCSLDQSENPSTSVQRIGDQFPMKRGREDLTETSRGREMPLNFTYENLSHERHLGMGVSNVGSGNGGVSLTLGLHQNGMGLSEAYPMTAARRFGLDLHEEAYGLSGFTTQNRQFGRDIIG